VAKLLNISGAEAKQAIAAMELQGYIEPAEKRRWRTTEQGETVSGAKTPRFTRSAVEQALRELATRIRQVNEDAGSPYRITAAAAFGDFLKDRTRVQAADVGIRLVPRQSTIENAAEAREEEAFLKKLRGKAATLNLQLYEDWMSERTHRKLL
jgi:hypothetical protein